MPVLPVLYVCEGEIILEKGEMLSEKRHYAALPLLPFGCVVRVTAGTLHLATRGSATEAVDLWQGSEEKEGERVLPLSHV